MKDTKISNSVGITIVPPKNFSISGETKVVPKEKEDSSDEELLKNLYTVLENLREQEVRLVDMINSLRKKLGFKCCQE